MIAERTCPRCGAKIYESLPRVAGRPRRWCSQRCRRAASEERRAAANGAIVTEYVQVDATLDDHVSAVLESPAACRRILRALRERSVSGTLTSGQWSAVEDELQRNRPQQRSQLRWGTR